MKACLECQYLGGQVIAILFLGFTELNTQIGLDEGSLVVGTIPIHSFKTFAMRILFPGLQDHPVLHPVEVSTPGSSFVPQGAVLYPQGAGTRLIPHIPL